MDESYLEWLIGLPGLGEAKARRIAERFPSFERLQAATHDELSAVEGVTSADIEALRGLLSDGSGQDASGQLFLCPQCGSFAGTAAKSCPFCGVEFEASADSGLSDLIEDFVAEEDAPARMCLTCGAGMGREATKCDVWDARTLPKRLPCSPGSSRTSARARRSAPAAVDTCSPMRPSARFAARPLLRRSRSDRLPTRKAL